MTPSSTSVELGRLAGPRPSAAGQRRFLFIVNQAAAGGRGQVRWDKARRLLERQPFQARVVFSEGPGHAREVALGSAASSDVVVAAGGDGTVNEVADGLIQSGRAQPTLGVLPLGTGNDVAQMLGLGDLATAVAALSQGVARPMDVIEVRCQDHGQPVVRHALLFASVGFAGELLRRTTPRVKRWFGPKACYSVGLFRALPAFRAPFLRLDWDGHCSEGKFFLACVANAEFAGGGMMKLGPGARLDDGLLNVSLIAELGLLEVFRCFPQLRQGRHVTHPKVRYGTGRVLQVDAEPAMDVQMDGDVFGRTPVTFAIRPLALAILRKAEG